MQVQIDTHVERKMDHGRWVVERWVDGASIGQKWDYGVGG